MSRILAVQLTLMTCLSGCASGLGTSLSNLETSPRAQRESPQTSNEIVSQVETLRPGDIFELKVLGEEDLSGKFRVSGSGEVTLPLVGRLSVMGIGLTDFEAQITEKGGGQRQH